MNNLKDKVTDAVSSLGEGATDVAKDIQSHATEAWDSVQKQTTRAMRESGAYVCAHPAYAAVVAIGVGMILGMLLFNRCSCLRSANRQATRDL